MNACPRCATVLLPGASVCSACGLILNVAPPVAPVAPPAPPAPVAPPAPPAPVPVVPQQQPGAPYGGLTTPLPESAEPAPARRSRGPNLPKRTVILLLLLVIVVVGGAAYYEIHKSSNDNNPPAANVGAQTLTPRSTPPTKPALTQAQADAQSDLRDLAISEEAFLTDTDRYTTSSKRLDHEGFRQTHFAGAVSFAGADGNKGYCLVGSAGNKAPFYLYDSANRGLQAASFPSAKSAENACSDHAIKHYAHIT